VALTRQRRRPEDEEHCGDGRDGKAAGVRVRGVDCVCGEDLDQRPKPESRTGCWAGPGSRYPRSPKTKACAKSGEIRSAPPRCPAPPLSSTPAVGNPQGLSPARSLRMATDPSTPISKASCTGVAAQTPVTTPAAARTGVAQPRQEPYAAAPATTPMAARHPHDLRRRALNQSPRTCPLLRQDATKW
jgi:hypothetical protein